MGFARRLRYIGHADAQMQAGSLGSGDISFPIEPIIMGPPNLKIHVKRKYKIDKDLTASSDTITRLIGFEGASLTSDNFVAIYTDWLDHDGRPMPESLKGAGYTGRIATIASDQALSSVNQFSIDPGQQLQVLQLPTALTDSTHFYLHVSGEPQSGNPIFAGSTDSVRLVQGADFSSSGQNPGILAKRPDNYVPFLSPVYDEANTELQTQAYRLLKKDDPDTYNEAPEPLYKWVYRPEMQFTSYDLEIDKINRSIDLDGDGQFSNPLLFGEDEIIDLLVNDNPTLTSNSVVNILYNLNTTNLIPLDFFNAGSDKELVFVIGETELTATIGDDQELLFDDLTHLDLLSPDDYLLIQLYANNDMGNSLWEWAYINVALAADFNRDGKIEFSRYLTEKIGDNDIRTDLNTTDKPYVFWVNDDDDDEDSEVKGNDTNEYVAVIGDVDIDFYFPDHNNGIIDGSRDLIDFFAVAINIHSYLSSNEGEDNNTYLLQHEDEAVNVVYTVMSRGIVEGGGLSSDYLKKIDMGNVTSIFGDWQTEGALGDVPVYEVTADGIEIPDEFIKLIRDDRNKGVILVEGNAETTKPLKITIRDENDVAIGEGDLPLKIATVTSMYQSISLRDNNRDTLSTKWGSGTVPSLDAINADLVDQENNLVAPDTIDKSRRFIFMHGFNVDEQSATQFQNETFKRLYHSGSNMLFTGIGWNGNEAFWNLETLAGLNYWGNVENAFYTADDLKELVELGITGSKKIIAGHSLGNMVISSAIHDFGLNIDQYFMINPAVAIEAYDATQLNPIQMRHTDWDVYYDAADIEFKEPAGRRLWSTEWYTLFADERNKLTWRNRFTMVADHPGVIQYCSNGEDVLQRDDVGIPIGLEGLDANAWSVQEKAKGTNLIAGQLVPGETSGGWGFNVIPNCVPEQDPFDSSLDVTCTTDELTASEAFAITNEELKVRPFFKPFANIDLLGINGGSAAALVSHPYILANEIAALSFASGSTRVNKFNQDITFDMNANANGWPSAERGLNQNVVEWHHSDFKNVSYLYTHKVFDDMVSKGAMR